MGYVLISESGEISEYLVGQVPRIPGYSIIQVEEKNYEKLLDTYSKVSHEETNQLRWENIPIDKYDEIKALYLGDHKKKLLEIYNEYDLGDYEYGCCNLQGMMNWFKQFVEEYVNK